MEQAKKEGMTPLKTFGRLGPIHAQTMAKKLTQPCLWAFLIVYTNEKLKNKRVLCAHQCGSTVKLS